jgi:hypothetical protein
MKRLIKKEIFVDGKLIEVGWHTANETLVLACESWIYLQDKYTVEIVSTHTVTGEIERFKKEKGVK